MNYQRLEDNVFVSINFEDLIDGDRIKKEVAPGVWQECNYHTEQTISTYEIDNLTVTTNGTAANWTLSGDHVAEIGDDIVISCGLVDGSAVTYPGAIIKLPIVRHADNKPTDDEIYFNVSIIDGLLTASGTIPRSGDWKLLTSRINKALDRINAGWHLDADDLGFLV